LISYLKVAPEDVAVKPLNKERSIEKAKEKVSAEKSGDESGDNSA